MGGEFCRKHLTLQEGFGDAADIMLDARLADEQGVQDSTEQEDMRYSIVRAAALEICGAKVCRDLTMTCRKESVIPPRSCSGANPLRSRERRT